MGELWEAMRNMFLIVTPPKKQGSVYLFSKTCQGLGKDCLQKLQIPWHCRTATWAAKSMPPGRGMQFGAVGRQAGGHWSGTQGHRVGAPAASIWCVSFSCRWHMTTHSDCMPHVQPRITDLLCTHASFSRGTDCLLLEQWSWAHQRSV